MRDSESICIAHVTLTNAEQFTSECGSKVKPTVDASDGRFLVRGGSKK